MSVSSIDHESELLAKIAGDFSTQTNSNDKLLLIVLLLFNKSDVIIHEIS
jgi:hypothetical protein